MVATPLTFYTGTNCHLSTILSTRDASIRHHERASVHQYITWTHCLLRIGHFIDVFVSSQRQRSSQTINHHHPVFNICTRYLMLTGDMNCRDSMNDSYTSSPSPSSPHVLTVSS